MSGEIHPAGPSGLSSCFVRIISYSGQYWNGTILEDFNAGNLALYNISVTEDGSTGVYKADMPSALPVGVYDVVLYNSDGEQIGAQYIQWRGVGAGGVVEQIGDINYLNIKTMVQYNLGRYGDVDILAQMSLWAKFALRDITNWRDHWFLHGEAVVPTVVDQQEYDLPDDFKGNLHIAIETSEGWTEINGPIDLVEARRRFSPNDEGDPTDWSSYYANQFKVWPPKPQQIVNMKLDYTRYILDLVDDEDTNTITVWYPQLLVALMCKYGFRYLQEHEEAKEWDAEANRILGDIHANYVARTLGRDFHLGVRAGVFGTNATERGKFNFILLR